MKSLFFYYSSEFLSPFSVFVFRGICLLPSSYFCFQIPPVYLLDCCNGLVQIFPPIFLRFASHLLCVKKPLNTIRHFCLNITTATISYMLKNSSTFPAIPLWVKKPRPPPPVLFLFLRSSAAQNIPTSELHTAFSCYNFT